MKTIELPLVFFETWFNKTRYSNSLDGTYYGFNSKEELYKDLQYSEKTI